MIHKYALIAVAVLVAAGSMSWSYFNQSTTGSSMTSAAETYLAALSEQQRDKSTMQFDSQERVDWHFIPKDHRKGLQIKEMDSQQRQAALALLRSCLSAVGYDKATKIMELEGVLAELEKGRQGGPLRDPERYYFTVFGEPAAAGKWGLSIEGHHLSLNFVVKGNQVVSSTPTFFAAHPAIMKSNVLDVPAGTRVLAQEEELAFQLLHSLNGEQRDKAVLADKARREIRAAGEPQPPTEEPAGIRYDELNPDQQQTMRQLVMAYARNLPQDVATKRLAAIRDAGPANVHFAWEGADQLGIGHYYRVQGPTFLIEFVNTQPDAAGNPANHIHCVWRDMRGDFAIPLATGD